MAHFTSSKQATRAAQNEIYEQSSLAERRILGAVAGSSDQLQEDIKSLSKRIDNLSLDAATQAIEEFTALHGDVLQRLSTCTNSVFQPEKGHSAYADSRDSTLAYDNTINSLYFPRITERQEQIPEAYRKTYRWILEPRPGGTLPWDSFISWLRDPFSESRIFWVHGKIGAGKTVLLRFLAENLDFKMHMLPWAENAAVLKASYFFWSGGNKLQKSVTGLLRTLLLTIFEQMPEVLPKVVPPRKWQTAGSEGKHNVEWTESELFTCLKDIVSLGGKNKVFFVLVDGLDEIEGSDESRTDLLELILDLASTGNVKICLSSRPWNIFKEAFGNCPQLKLEQLTHSDIRSYVTGQLHGNRRFQRLSEYDGISAKRLVEKIILKAAGVFLWVRLVVRQLLQGLRDGDGMSVLNDKVDGVPEDIENYFTTLLESIEPSNRAEASKIFQIALYSEDNFISLHSNCLLDFSFVEQLSPQFALSGFNNFQELNFTEKAAIAFRLGSTLRKLNSRCLGLLECHEDTEKYFEVQEFHLEKDLERARGKDNEEPSEGKSHLLSNAAADLDESNALKAAGWTVDFTHRSVRDFLLNPKMQSRLHHYSQGRVDVRLYILNARIAQLVALNGVNACSNTAIGLASYILCCIATPVYRETAIAMKAATKIRPVFEKMVLEEAIDSVPAWYIECVLRSWHDEKSTFLTVAIDYGVTSYVHRHLTPQSLQSKEGRPVLDYVLRPRFMGGSSVSMYVGNQLPNLKLLRTTLEFGADPNQTYENVSVWALFLCCVSDYFRDPGMCAKIEEERACIESLRLLLKHGTDLLLPRDWICGHHYYYAYYHDSWLSEDSSRYIERRFPGAEPAIRDNKGQTTCYLVSDLLESLGTHLELSIDIVKSLALQREAQELAWLFQNPTAAYDPLSKAPSNDQT